MIKLVPNGFTSEAQFVINDLEIKRDSVVLWDPVAKQFWFASDEDEMSEAFFFLGDMYTIMVDNKDSFMQAYNFYAKGVHPYKLYSLKKYMLYSDELKIFDPYSVKAYPIEKYGKPIPRGMSVGSYESRELRDLTVEQFIHDGYTCIFNSEIHDRLLEEYR